LYQQPAVESFSSKGSKEGVMEKWRRGCSLLKPATYRISVLGTLDKKRSDYYGSMTIEHASDPHHRAMTILTGRLADQSALIGVLNALYDRGYPILSVECLEAP
jgi:hypothetical protein